MKMDVPHENGCAPWKWMCPMKMDVPHVNGWAHECEWMDFAFFLFLGTLDRCWIRFPSRWAPQAQSEAWKIYPWKQPGVVLPRYTSAEGSPRLVRTFFSTGVAQGQMSKKWAPSCARLGAATHASNSVSFLPPHPPVISFESGEQNTHHPKKCCFNLFRVQHWLLCIQDTSFLQVGKANNILENNFNCAIILQGFQNYWI